MLSPLLLHMVFAEIGEMARRDKSDPPHPPSDGISSVAIVETWFIVVISMGFFDAGEPVALPGIFSNGLPR